MTLSVRNRISRRDVVELCEQLFRARISTGTVDAILARAGDALEDPYEDLLRRVRGAKALNMDDRLAAARSEASAVGRVHQQACRAADRRQPARGARP